MLGETQIQLVIAHTTTSQVFSSPITWINNLPAEVSPMGRTFSPPDGEEVTELRRGPWTREEDDLLVNYIAHHGEGRWNLLSKYAGLKRTGKSCRLRWLNYLKPDVKRGNLSPQEQLLILELHFKWGNRWSKIAQHLPGRTDNEIKNYWRTRVQKQSRLLKVESNSKHFLDAVRFFWMPRLLHKANSHNSSVSSMYSSQPSSTASPSNLETRDSLNFNDSCGSSGSSTSLVILGKSPEQPEATEGRTAHPDDNINDAEGICGYIHQNLDDGNYVGNMGCPDYDIINDVDVVSAFAVHDGPASLSCDVDESDVVSNVVENGFWTAGGLW